MLKLFFLTWRRFGAWSWQALVVSPDGETAVSWRRRLVMLAFLPLLALVLLLHWLGLFADELLFRGERRVVIREPLFILGVPRSGTTTLHHILAQDPQFTTFRTWECLFALSVSARRFWLALARVDGLIGQPGRRLVRWIERRGFAALDAVHPMSLDSPEEDYFALLPVLSCFILVLPFPFAEHLWRVGRFDADLKPDERQALVDFHYRCLQKHLYVHGSEKRLLSKNAAFAPLAHSLVARYSDARFIVCVRDPVAALPSQLSSIRDGLAFFGVPPQSAAIRERLIDQLQFYYLNLSQALATVPAERQAWLQLGDLRDQLDARISTIYRQFDWPLGAEFSARLVLEARASARYQSRHRYQLAEFALDAQELAQQFAAVYADPNIAACLGKAPAMPAPQSIAPQPPPLRVAILSDAAPERNGVGAYYRDLTEHLRDIGAQVSLISPRYRQGRWYGGVPLPLPGDPTQRFLLPNPWHMLRRLRRSRPQAVIIPTPGPWAMLGLVLAQRQHNLRIIVGFHTHFEQLAAINQDWWLRGVRGYLARTYLNFCNRWLFRASDLVLANSQHMVDLVRTMGAHTTGLMGTPIAKRFLDTPLCPLNRPLERVLFAGRLAPEKNLQAVIAAAEALPQLHFWIAGEGPMRPWLQQQAQRLANVELLGWINRSALLTRIDQVDALVLPSTVESFGTIALEAMARARLVVVSPQCGILSWKQLQQGLFAMAADESLTEALTRLQQLDVSQRQQIARCARTAAETINADNLNNWLKVLGKGQLRGIDHV